MLWTFFFLLFLHFRCISSKLVTTIIDDAFAGDTQSSITYSPLAAWLQGSASNHGRITPDATQAQDGTWHDATDDTTPDHDGTTPTFMEITFEGTGIDVRCIIANNETPSASIPAFTGTKANYSFFIDSVPQNQDYVHEAGTTGDVFLYNTSVFSTNTLSTGPHTLKLLLNGGPEVNGSVLLLFDYAIVTSDDETSDEPGPSAGQSASPTPSMPANPSSSSSISLSSAHKSNLEVGAIVGGLVGGLTLVLLLLCFWLCRKRKRAHPPPYPPTTSVSSLPISYKPTVFDPEENATYRTAFVPP
ncbi:hypothetical protein MSAN_00411900 [Mycena sanguinolenta]|uniref:Uncharacterized protein n=1 Tax=Mycena sanguinolenta TaxID=230812 RepID=A0A8H7DJ73_9AGAR|nr:hypothetical protein MSAN_00411900 [Mycena sanguinolenta]